MPYWLHRDEVLKSLLVDSNSFVFAGDSHIQEFELAEIFHSIKMKNRGICYDTSLGLLNRVDELTKGQPAKVFIEIGVNDLAQNKPVDTVVKNLANIVNNIATKSPNSKIYLQSVLPNKLTLEKILLLNKRIKELATTRNIMYIDLQTSFLDKGLKKKYDSGDGVYLNSAGYFKWRDILLPYVNN
ncbi:MAG: sialate O-acetylesterase [Mucilaginibacter sp.]|nr:sialate O-acetylesterase [Mucilaginibacter sp.]